MEAMDSPATHMDISRPFVNYTGCTPLPVPPMLTDSFCSTFPATRANINDMPPMYLPEPQLLVINNVHTIDSMPKVCESEEKKEPKKRKRDPSSWKRIKQKEARNKGESYINTRGIEVPAKVPKLEGSLCAKDDDWTCRLRCSDSVSREDRQAIFDHYYTLDANEKNRYVFSNITVSEPLTKKRITAKKNKGVSCKYFVKIADRLDKVRICKTAFETLHKCATNKLDHMIKQKKNGAEAPHPVLSGKHKNRPRKIADEDVEKVKRHVDLVHKAEETMPSSSLVTDSSGNTSVPVARMYKSYLDWCKTFKHRVVSEHMYRDIKAKYDQEMLELEVVKKSLCGHFESKGSPQKKKVKTGKK